MNQLGLRQAAAETRERLSEEELERLEELARRAVRDERFVREFAMSPRAMLEEYGLSPSTLEGAVIDVVDPETEGPHGVVCILMYGDPTTGEICALVFVS